VSHFDYEASKVIVQNGFPFYALVMAAMRQADTRNMARLEQAFPDVAAELRVRYNAPGGVLPGEQVSA
jgi:hypothetical protein